MHPTLLSVSKTIHVYLTMFGLLVMLGFAVTGFTANHEDWFGATRPWVTESQGQTPVELIEKSEALRIVEHLRQAFHVTGALGGYDNADDRISLGFKSPGDAWEIEIEKATGKTSVHHEVFNTIAVLNNLHRGRYTGTNWSWVIDFTALLIVLACATGLILWLALPRRRKLGTAAMLAGAVVALAVYCFYIPGADAIPETMVPPAVESKSDETEQEPISSRPTGMDEAVDQESRGLSPALGE